MDQPVFRPAIHSQITHLSPKKPITKAVPADSRFANLLGEAIQKEENGITISKHARIRMEQRNLHVNEETWDKLGEKLNEAKRKGIKDSLVLLDGAALIVNTHNKTVITALDRQETASYIFSDINGAIILD